MVRPPELDSLMCGKFTAMASWAEVHAASVLRLSSRHRGVGMMWHEDKARFEAKTWMIAKSARNATGKPRR
jgi:hypothetical protein